MVWNERDVQIALEEADQLQPSVDQQGDHEAVGENDQNAHEQQNNERNEEYESRSEDENEDEEDEAYISRDEDNLSEEDARGNKDSSKTRLNIKRLRSNQKKCCVCQRTRENSNQKQQRVSKQAIVNAYILKNVLIPFGSRACSQHFNENKLLSYAALSSISVFSDSTQLSGQDCTVLFELMRKEVLKNSLFDLFETMNAVPSQLCKRITGKSLKDEHKKTKIKHKLKIKRFFIL